jgi:hypothetical protein
MLDAVIAYLAVDNLITKVKENKEKREAFTKSRKYYENPEAFTKSRENFESIPTSPPCTTNQIPSITGVTCCSNVAGISSYQDHTCAPLSCGTNYVLSSGKAQCCLTIPNALSYNDATCKPTSCVSGYILPNDTCKTDSSTSISSNITQHLPSSSTEISMTMSTGGIIAIVVGIIAFFFSCLAFYLSWTSNKKIGIKFGWRVFYAIFAFLFGINYDLNYYFLKSDIMKVIDKIDVSNKKIISVD